MGTWGYNTFENDAGCDWTYGLDEAADLTYVTTTLEQAFAGKNSEIGAEEALAACEVIARLRGNWGKRDAFTEGVDEWVSAHPQSVPDELAVLARRAIVWVSEDSDLRKRWDESGSSKEWLECVEDLKRRVTAS